MLNCIARLFYHKIKLFAIVLYSKITVQWFESVTTLEITPWHLFNFNLVFGIKKAQNPCGLWVFLTCIY